MLLMCFYVNLELKMSREAIWGFLDNINVPYMVFVLLYRTALTIFCQNVLLNLLWTQNTLLIVENIHKFGKRLFTEELMS